ncbi:phytoene/squalene synthase family protein [Geotoga petraea]|uniref:Phytoene/squalene synthase family protein n=1 Tax=Geotoga petraea TaxID=28234 RepID=A0A4Z0VXQ8_9BACT|nr:phytoene/squalene synthase family protein [Geotoga petraea]TGG88888.1 phytoene/squalene synthase family protein [Geotoga petraea]
MGLKNDYRYCESIIKENSKTFYKAFSLLGKEKSNAIYAVYAYCRATDDSIDIHHSSEKLKILEKKLNDFEKGNTPDEPLWRALSDIFENYKMDIKPFYEMIEGQKMDIGFSQPEDQKDLLSYCYYVAGTVGKMLLPIIASEKHEEIDVGKIKLGEAMQITNILRDIGEDFENGRIYIPKNIMEKYNYSKNDLKNKVINDNFIKMWEYEAEQAQKMYDDFYNFIDYFDKDSKKSVLASAKLYNAILDAVRKNGYNCLTERNYINNIEKMKIISKIKL